MTPGHAYVSLMAQRVLPIVLVLTAIGLAAPVGAQTDDERYTIMRPEPAAKPQAKPEPWLAPKYNSPRGTRRDVTAPDVMEVPQPRAPTPPPIYVPETGRVLPNLPVVSGSGPGGAETAQDRAMRCAHQAGAYGAAAGDRNAYVGSCINQ